MSLCIGKCLDNLKDKIHVKILLRNRFDAVYHEIFIPILFLFTLLNKLGIFRFICHPKQSTFVVINGIKQI